MQRILEIVICYALIPFIACLCGFALAFFGLSDFTIAAVPLVTALIYILFHKKIDMAFAAKVNGLIIVLLLVCFTVMMAISSGNMEGVLMTSFSWFIFPFAPIILIHLLMGEHLVLYTAALLTYAAAFLVTAFFGRIRMKKTVLPVLLSAVCIIVSAVLYVNRPSVKYAGHGFDYMHGYSSTDFSDYMVYSENCRLAMPESPVSLVIENEEDMPVLDGAEACYPLYAAYAKAAYKDIDVIEKAWLEETQKPDFNGGFVQLNGRIVQFTNSVVGFSRLLNSGEESSDDGYGIDMFFGAKPSASQLAEAAELGVDLEITPIGREAFVFFVEEDNPVNDIRADQLKAIYHGDITNWKELGGASREILAFQRPKNSGSQTMMEYFMGDISLKEPMAYEKVDAMSGVIQEVAQYANEKGAIGYSFRYFLEELNQEEGVKMLAIDGIYPSLENIENGSYPLVTNVCLITRQDERNPYVERMKEFILSDEGQAILRQTGYAVLAD